MSNSWVKWWKAEKRKCIEGYWVEGKWMPGNLYFYINFCKISLNKNAASKTKITARPFLRDLEWEKAYVFAEARGFSGFEEDEDYTCYRPIGKYEEGELDISIYNIPDSCYKKDGSFKKYKDPRGYLREIHSKNLGKPLYENESWNVIDIECRGSGKDLLGSTLLHYSDGTKRPISDVKVGDEIFGADGKPTKVIQRKDFNDQMQYKVTFASGKEVICGGGHLWTVFFRGKKKTVELNDIKDSLYWERSSGVKDYKYAVPTHKEIMYTGESPNIDPYYLGLWLGDGNKHNTGVTTMDKEIADYLDKVRIDEGMSTLNVNNKPGNLASTYTITNGGKGGTGGYSNQLKNKLRDLGLLNNKHIPECVLRAPYEYRMLVLQGLMDSDGSIDKGHIELCTSYKGIQDTILELLSGLGIKYNARLRKTKGQDSLRISLLTDKKVFKLKRKLDKQTTPSKATIARQEKVKIVSVEEVGVKPSVCIAVDNEDSLFLVDDYVVTHNSFWAAGGMIAWHYLMDGANNYDEFLQQREAGNGMKSETLVGAIDAKYSKDLLTKVQGMFDNLAGERSFQGEYYPSPFHKESNGSWFSGKQFIEAKVDKKIGGKWQRVGSGSVIHHRSFKDNPLAANGTRPGLSCLEEVGFMDNLKGSLGAMKDTTYNGPLKFGTIYMFGTGGGMDSGASDEAMEVFNDPGAFDCLSFNDIWEETGDIGFFVPYELGLNEFKNMETGETDLIRATKYVDNKREALTKKKSKAPLYDEMQNNPRVPSEAFLILNANIFPIGELKEHYNWLKSNQHDSFIKGQNGELTWVQNKEGGPVNLEWKPDLTGKLEPCWFKMKKEDPTQGCIQIWEHPQMVGGSVPYGLYIAGTDPYDQDQAPNTPSLGSTFIYKTFHTDAGIYEWPVAEYTARPSTAEEHHENVRKLLTYYNAIDLYENERNTLKMHFSHKHSLHLLAKQPDILKATEGSKVQRMYGIHMTEQIKDEIEIYTRDWLLKDAGNGKLNLHKIYSLPLLQELIYYNRDGNFDRVIAFMLTIVHRLQNHHIKVKEVVKSNMMIDDEFFKRGLKGGFFK